MAEAVLEEIYESEMSSTEVDELRSILEDVLLSSGKFTSKQVSEWLEGFDACEIDEHRRSLIEYAYTFIESGEEQEARFADILETNLLSDKEKAELWLKIERMSYHERNEWLEYVESLLQKAKKLDREVAILKRSRELSENQKGALISEYQKKKVSEREKMVAQLPAIIVELKRKNESERIVSRIQDLIDRKEIGGARKLLSSGIVMGSRYRELERRISSIEIEETRRFLATV